MLELLARTIFDRWSHYFILVYFLLANLRQIDMFYCQEQRLLLTWLWVCGS
jgi:hypothetical protein